MNDLERLGHASLAHGAQAVDHGASNHRAARAQRPGLEHVLARADTAVHPHLSLRTHRVHDRRQRLNAGLRPVELPPAVVAHHDGVGAAQHRQLGVFHVLNAFEDQLAAPLLLDPGHVFPRQAGVKLLIGPRGQRAHIAHALDVADQVAKGVAARAGHAQTPARLGHQVDDVGNGGARWRGQAVFQVFVALANHLQIQGQHQRAATGFAGALDHVDHGLAVAHHVELEPKRRRGVGGHVLNRANAHGREDEGNAKFLRCLGGLDLAVGALHAGQAHGRDSHRHLDLGAGHGGGCGAVFHVDGHALAQLDLLEVLLIGAVGAFGPAARVGVVVKHARHALFGQNAQVFNIGDHSHGGVSLGIRMKAW